VDKAAAVLCATLARIVVLMLEATAGRRRAE
jgi:hypothetical protein